MSGWLSGWLCGWFVGWVTIGWLVNLLAGSIGKSSYLVFVPGVEVMNGGVGYNESRIVIRSKAAKIQLSLEAFVYLGNPDWNGEPTATVLIVLIANCGCAHC